MGAALKTFFTNEIVLTVAGIIAISIAESIAERLRISE